MNRVRPLRRLMFAALLGLAPALAQGVSMPAESCMQCKFLPCLKEFLAQKRKMQAVYQGLRDFWAPHSEYDTGKAVAEMDVSGLPKAQRDTIYLVIMKQLGEYQKMEDSRTSAVPPPEGCGFPKGAEIGASTDSLSTCMVDTDLLLKAMSAMPCKELADLILAHENLHAARCAARKLGRSWVYSPPAKDGEAVLARTLPPRLLTPYGKAAEEMAGYQLEIDAIQKMVDELEKRCHPKRDYTSGQPTDGGPATGPRTPLPSFKPPPPAPLPSYKPKPITKP